MNTPNHHANHSQTLSRRDFLARGSAVAATSALAGVSIPWVHAAEDNTIRLALIGCGGRGSGAVADAFDSPQGPVKLTVMADLFQNRLDKALQVLSEKFPDRVDVPPDRRFVGFDAYRKAIDCLRPGDVAMLTGYSAFRPMQLEYAVEKGINVFMEKSFAPDAPGLRRLIKAGEAAEKKNLKIAAGLQCRHSRNRLELIQRMRDGELGQMQLIRAYRMQPVGDLGKKPADEKELFWQIRNFVHFIWVSGGLFAEMNIHQIDEICWIKDSWPVTAHGVGGRAANSTDCSQNLDSLSIEWTFADGTKATGRRALAAEVPRGVRHLHSRHQMRRPVLRARTTLAPCKSTRTSAAAPTTSPGAPAKKRSRPGRPSGPPCSKPSARTSPTTKPNAPPCPTWPTSWAAPPSTPARSSPGTR